MLQIDGTIHFEGSGKYSFGHGCRLCVGEKANLFFGEYFSNTAEMTIVCMKEIRIGHHVTTSWNTLIMDTDFHATQNTITKECHQVQSPVLIGNHVWICTRAVVLKGSEIPNGCIVGANAVVTSKYQVENALIAGNPSTIKKEHIVMKR